MTEGFTQPDIKDKAPETALPSLLRRCLVSGEAKPKAALIRFVLDPEKRVVPDLAERLPGRGLWVSAERAALEEAARKNLFSKAAKTKTVVSGDLADQVGGLFSRRVAELLGLAKAANAVVTREPAVLEALSKGEIEALILAVYAGGDIEKKLSRAPILFRAFTAASLGAALGREKAVAAGLKPHPLTTKLRQELTRWQGVGASLYDPQMTTNGSSKSL